MKFFPFILARIAGLPFELLERLSLQSVRELEVLMEKNASLEKRKTELLQLLENSSKEIHCSYVLKNLGYLKNQLLHGKKAKLSKHLESNLEYAEKPYFKKIEQQLKLYQSDLNDLKTLENDFENLYQQEIFNSRLYLQKISCEEVILNGLLMSSHSFLEQLQKYSQTKIASFAKKQFQTERAFLQYLSRICCKTSPFSTFTPLAVFSLNPSEKLHFEPKTMIRLNNHLLALWRDGLNNYPPFFRKLKVSLNISLKQSGEEWSFLLNTRNVESIQKMENNELLELLVENMDAAGGQMVFEQLATKILPNVETDIPTLEAYLLELIDFGFLEWRWSFSGLDPFWDNKLKKDLEPFSEDRFLLQIEKSIEHILEKLALSENADFPNRKQLQLEAFEIAKQVSELLLQKTQQPEKERVVNIDQLKHFKANRFQFTPERLFYEDVRIPFEPRLDSVEVAALIKELDVLLDCLNVLFFNSAQLKLKHFFLENYQKNDAVNLFDFYEDFYKSESKTDLHESQKAVALRLEWQKEIFQKSRLSKSGILTIDLDLLKSLFQKIKPSQPVESQSSRGSFIQVFREGNLLKGFSETSFEGNGKMMGRFLHLFPSNISEALQKWNESQRNGLLWIENTDASIYNPNLHPPLLPFEIRMPGSQNNLPVENQIAANELVVVFNKAEEKLNLVHQPTGRKAYIFDMGFEALESRSPLYRLLATFNYPTPSQSILTEIVNNYFDKIEGPGINFFPRICVGNQLVIQRKRWLVSKNYLPLKQNSETESGYFICLNRWIRFNQIPSKVFITVKTPENKDGVREKTDDYKPQYIDFESPVFVQLFHKLIKKVKDKLKIEEFLPFPEEQINSKFFASEYLIQWESATN